MVFCADDSGTQEVGQAVLLLFDSGFRCDLRDDSQEEVILVRQFRPPRGVRTLEFPAGYLDKGESPVEAARRELAEETGYVCDELIHQGIMRIFSSRMDYTIHTCFGRNARPSASASREKGIQRVVLPRQTFERYVRNGTFDSATCIAQYFLAKENAFYRTRVRK